MESYEKIKNRNFRLALVVITVILTLNLIYTETTGRTGPIAGVVGVLLNPVQRAIYNGNQKIENTIEFFFTFSDVKKENEELKKKVSQYETGERRFSEVEKENADLKAMFNFKDRYTQYEFLGTNIINRNVVSLSPSYTLDKGFNDGVKPGMVVITYNGLAGQITEVFSTYSILETISSENVKVSVTSAGAKNYEGILSGTSVNDRVNMAQITQLSLESDVKVSDFIVTSGIGGFYPPDIPIGSIENVAEDKGKLMKTATVRPIVSFTGNELFYIVLPKNKEEVIY